MLTRIPINQPPGRSCPCTAALWLLSLLIGMGMHSLTLAGDKAVTQVTSSDSEDETTEESMEEDPPSGRVTPVKAQVAADEEEMPDVPTAGTSVQLPERVVGNGFGSMGRVSHLMNQTFGRYNSITPIEYFPYLLTDANFFFADMRGFVTNNSQGGGNLGIGYRRLFDDWNAWGGASLWYDADQSTGKMFQQIGLSFEYLFQQFEVRSNVYLPVTSTLNFANTITNPQIVGTQLLYTRTTDIGTPMRGVDVEVGYSRPVLDKHIVRGFIGGYFFQGNSVSDVTGIKARVEGVINNAVTAQVLYTNDNLFGSNFMVGISMQFPFGKDHPNTGWIRNTPSPFRFVERNYNVIVDRNENVANNQVAADPTTGKDYVVYQVNPTAGGTPDGTAANPYTSVGAAQGNGGNIFLVQNGSVLNQPIALTSGQFLFGQGNYNEGVPTAGGGIVPMPPLASSVTQVTPVIQNVTGSAITLASNTQVAGFNITGPSGDGITGSGLYNVNLHDLTFSSIGADAINLSNSSGNVNLSNIQINSATGSGIVISGGTPDLVFNGGGDTISASQNGFVLQNLTGGSVTLNNLALTNIGGTGLLIDPVKANVNVNSLSVSQSGSSGSAVSISGDTATTQIINGVSTTVYNTYNFNGTTQINSPNGAGFSVANTDARINVANLNVTSTASQPAISLSKATGPITFGALSVNTNGGTGLYASDVTSLSFVGGRFAAVNATALDVTNSGLNGQIAYINVYGGAYGISIAGSTGTLSIPGSGSVGSGGTIQNTTTDAILINGFGTTTLNWVSFLNNATGIQSTGETLLSVNSSFFTGNTGFAVNSMNDTQVSMASNTFSSNGSSSGGTIQIQANALGSYTSYLGNNNITDNNGTGVLVATTGSGVGSTLNFTFQHNTVAGYKNNSPLINLNWSGPTTSTIVNNVMSVYGSGMTAFLLQDPSSTGVLTETVSSNTITFESPSATSGTGFWFINGQSGVTSTGTSNLTISNNILDFNATGGTGMRFGLYNTNTTFMDMNIVTDTAGGATGFLYDYVAASSNLQVTQNVVTLLASDSLTHRGFVFTQVAPKIALYTAASQGSTFNWVYNATSNANVFSIPSGVATGGLIINSTYFTSP